MKFNTKSQGIKTINRAGGAAYSMVPEYELATLVLTSFNEKKFYESAGDQNKRLIELLEKVSKEFIANLALFARKEFHMRSISHVLLAELARLHKGQKQVIVDGIERLDDMNEIVAYYGNKYGKPIPNSIKKAIREKLTTFNAYKLGKYKSANKDVKLVDLFNLTHPKPKDEKQAEMWKKLMKGELESPDTWEVLISTAKNDDERRAHWERLVIDGKIGYMALLRNLRNLIKYNVSEAVIDKACAMISDKEAVKNSKQLPFRFWSAYQNAPHVKMKDAVSIAMDHATDNVPKLDGRTAIIVDTSSSMNSSLSGKSDVQYVDIARLFGCAMFKANPYNSEIFGFDSDVRQYNFSSRTPVIDMINKIEARGGSTELWKVFNGFKNHKKMFERVIIFSDMQAWNASNWGGWGYSKDDGSVIKAFNEWSKELPKKPTIYSVDLAGNGTSQFGDANLVAGWSEKIFSIMKILEQDKNAFINIIKNYEVRKETTVHNDTDESSEPSEA